MRFDPLSGNFSCLTGKKPERISFGSKQSFKKRLDILKKMWYYMQGRIVNLRVGF